MKLYQVVLMGFVFCALVVVGAFGFRVHAQELDLTPEEQQTLDNAASLGLVFNAQLRVKPKDTERVSSYRIVTPNAEYHVNNYVFNQQGTCVSTDINVLVCGSFSILET